MCAQAAALLSRIAAEVSAREPQGEMTTRIVAVDGLGGAGKTTLARHISRALGGAAIVQTDDFASWDNPLDWWPQLIEQVLEPLARNAPARFKPTAWIPGEEKEWVEIQPAAYVILEGVSASREAFRPYLTYAVWVEAPAELRLRRGLERDGEAARPQWEAWMASEERYRLRERPDARADIVVSGGADLWRSAPGPATGRGWSSCPSWSSDTGSWSWSPEP